MSHNIASQFNDTRDKRGNLVVEAGKILSTAVAENREMTKEETEKFNAMHVDAEALRSKQDLLEQQYKIESEMANVEPKKAVKGFEVRAAAELPKVENASTDKDEYNRDFQMYMSTGIITPRMAQMSMRAIGESGISGFSVNDGFDAMLIDQLKNYTGIRLAPITIIDTDTSMDYPILVDNDTNNTGEQLAENAQCTIQAPTLSQITMKGWIYSSKMIQASMKSLNDLPKLEADVAKIAGIRIARIQNNQFTVGSNSGSAQGVITAAVANGNVITGAVGSATSFGAAPNGYNNLMNLENSIDAAYLKLSDGEGNSLCGYQFHQNTLNLIKQIVDGNDRPLWRAGLGSFGDASPDNIDSYPYWINNDVPQAAANATSAVFGYWPDYYVRDVKGATLLRLNERYADFLQVGFLAFKLSDGRTGRTNTFSVFTNSAT